MAYPNYATDRLHSDSQKYRVSRDIHLWVVGFGQHAVVVESDNPETVLKVTCCPETIELLRRLEKCPIAGLPEVLNEIHFEDVLLLAKEKLPRGKVFVCFELARYIKIRLIRLFHG